MARGSTACGQSPRRTTGIANQRPPGRFVRGCAETPPVKRVRILCEGIGAKTSTAHYHENSQYSTQKRTSHAARFSTEIRDEGSHYPPGKKGEEAMSQKKHEDEWAISAARHPRTIFERGWAKRPKLCARLAEAWRSYSRKSIAPPSTSRARTVQRSGQFDHFPLYPRSADKLYPPDSRKKSNTAFHVMASRFGPG